MHTSTIIGYTILATACFLTVTTPAMAQTFSYDGNRWYEIEVSIFANESFDENNELVIPDKMSLSYFDPSRTLIPASKIYQVPFAENNTAFVLSDALIGVQQASIAPSSSSPGFIGPKNYSASGDFRITDFNRDPFIALGSQAARFMGYNEKIDQSPDHRLLFHAVWRQPVLNRIQSTGIYIQGGDQYGNHYELEGSLRFSYDVNRVDVEARLWLASFAGAAELSSGNSLDSLDFPDFSDFSDFPDDTGSQDAPGQLPPLPDNPVLDTSSPTPGFGNQYSITDLAFMEQMRAMVSNELHYLDHPELGIIVEVRPYQLPEQSSFFD